MALIECPDCKGPLSSTADVCPHCGAKRVLSGPCDVCLVRNKYPAEIREGNKTCYRCGGTGVLKNILRW
jgi:hypothetical protein